MNICPGADEGATPSSGRSVALITDCGAAALVSDPNEARELIGSDLRTGG